MLKTINFQWNSRLNQLMIPAATLNKLLFAKWVDNFGWFQQTYNVFGFMKMSEKLKFQVKTFEGLPFVWQTLDSCAWDPLGSYSVGQTEVEPFPVKLNEELCYDELFNSCFEHLLTYGGKTVNLNNLGKQLIGQLTNTIQDNMIVGARNALIAGSLNDLGDVTFKDGTPEDIKRIFSKTISSVKGFIALLAETALGGAQYEHLDLPNIFDPDNFSGDKYTGDVIAIKEALMNRAKPELEAVVNSGGMPGQMEAFMLVSPSYYNAVVETYNKLCVTQTCINPRLTMESFTIGTGYSRRKIYYIDNLPIIPLPEVNAFAKYFTGANHFAAITVSGNIQFGGSFDGIPSLDRNRGGMGLMVQMETAVKNYGMFYFLSHQLMATAIADINYIVSTQEYATSGEVQIVAPPEEV